MVVRTLRRRSFGLAIVVVSVVLMATSAAALGNTFRVVTNGASAPSSTLAGVAARSSTDVWAVGGFRPTGAAYDDAGVDPFLEHFNGTTWTQTLVAGVRGFDENVKAAAAVSSNDVWAVGNRKRINFKSPVTTLAYHWNGAAWSEIATPTINANRYLFNAVAANASNDVWAVGQAATAPSTALNVLAEHWNGVSWSIVPVPLPSGTTSSALNAIGARATNDVWAVGTANGLTLVEHWNGSAWSVVRSVDTPPQRSGAAVVDTLTGVTAIAANNVWAAGYATDTVTGSGLPYRTVVEHFDGTRWSLVASPSPFGHNQLNGISAVSATDAWAVGWGWTDRATGVPIATPIVLHYDGTAWRSITPPANVGGGDNLLNGVAAIASGDTWAVGSSPAGALIERRT